MDQVCTVDGVLDTVRSSKRYLPLIIAPSLIAHCRGVLRSVQAELAPTNMLNNIGCVFGIQGSPDCV